MDRKALAVSYHTSGYNCAQAVLLACSDLTHLSQEASLAIAGGFGGGARHGDLCGAVSGAIMAIGLVHPYADSTDAEAKKRIARLTREVHRLFIERFGTNTCRDLLRADISTDEAMMAAKAAGVMRHCNDYIQFAVEIVEQLCA